ncbi:hypothetical protein BD560DRAFT_396730 [Blakeslea trispora]|nr:hypothetical protein BD560DRAFT_396730 [Blakeslea trispora]
MNYPLEQERARLQSNVDHYNRSSRLRAYCCGCIYGESNSVLICLCWAGLSFYFAVLAFMQKSPFYSYIQDVPLAVFGAINLLFGIVSICSIIIFLIKRPGMIYNIMQSRNTVFAIAIIAVAVLIVTLINFIFYAMNKDYFIQVWCIENSASSYVSTVETPTNNLTASNSTLTSVLTSNDIYNCERLFENEIKWGLMCLICMFVVYVSWLGLA